MLRKGGRNMDHPLLMLRSIESQTTFIRKLDYPLTETRDISMPEYAPNAFNKPVLSSIALRILVRYELHDCLSNRETNRFTHKLNNSFKSTKLESVAPPALFPGELSNIL